MIIAYAKVKWSPDSLREASSAEGGAGTRARPFPGFVIASGSPRMERLLTRDDGQLLVMV
jgi:hypothetical protein